MPCKHRFLHVATTLFVTVLVALSFTAAAADTPGSSQPVPPSTTPDPVTPICGSVLSPIVPLPLSDGDTHLVYDLVLTNWTSVPIGLSELRVIDPEDGDKVLEQWDQDVIPRLLIRRNQSNESATLEPGETAVFLAEVAVPAGETPSSIVHEVTFVSPFEVVPGLDLEGQRFGAFEVSGSPVVIDLPFEGDGWTAFEFLRLSDDPTAPSHHRTSIPGVSGQMVVAQRFAIDWMRVDRDGKLRHGDQNKAQNWVAYGAPLLAVADGTVVETVDRFEDSPLPYDNSARTLDQLAGNRVILEIGDGLYALYAHLKPGSVTVNVGDSVVRGEVLGELGQSGNSTAPHLHFHIMDRPSSSGLGAQGIPYVFEYFEGATPGRVSVDSDGAVSYELPDPAETQQCRNRLPTNLSVIGDGDGPQAD